MQTDYGSSSISQQVAAEWFRSGFYGEHIQYIRGELKRKRDFMLDVLNKYCKDIATWHIPLGSFYIWLHIGPEISSRILFEKALKENILLNPGNLYDRNAGDFLRLSYSYASLDEIEIGIKNIARLIKSLSV